jgi:hypothetical protein
MSAMVVTATTAAITSSEFGVVLGLVLALTLVGLLIQRELASAVGGRLASAPRLLTVAIAPLLVAFIMIAVGRFFATV